MATYRSLQKHPQHKLTGPQNQDVPDYWLFLDTETKPDPALGLDIERFHMGWTCLWIRDPLYLGEPFTWEFFRDEVKFCDYIENMANWTEDLHVVGHNIFFDLQASGFYYYFTQWGWQVKFYYDKGMTYILKIQKGKAKITILSTTNWFDQSLKEIGKKLGLFKGEIDFKTASDRKLKLYCKRDVEILVKTLGFYIAFIQKHQLGKFSLTKASQAFTAFRYRFMYHKILIHNNVDVQALERECYTGGRVECFYIGQAKGGPFVSMDINAAYPYVMKKYQYPYELIAYYENEPIDRYLDVLKTHSVCAEIEVDTKLAAFAIKHKGKTIFPIGNFTCFVCSEGLRFALRKGFAKRILRASVYARSDLFSAYVDYFHDIRSFYIKESDAIMELFCKYMHNALYGKFGQFALVTDITDQETGRGYFREDILDMVTGRMVTITHFMNKQLIQYQEGEGKNSNVAIAAHITENMRFALWGLMEDVGRSRVIYCDTDSIKIRQKALKYLEWEIHPTKMGALKCEDRSATLLIAGAKNYRTESVRKIKGIPKKAIEKKPGLFEYTSFGRQVQHLRSGQSIGAKVSTVTRKLKASYTKGIIQKNGKVLPFTFPMPS